MNRKTEKWLWGGFLVGAAAVLLDAWWLEQYFFQIKEYHIGNLNQLDRSVRILLLTDLHLGQSVDRPHRRLAAKIHEIAPDIIFISGDSVDKNGRAEALNEFLSLLPLSIPKAAVLGNHEREAGLDTDVVCHIYQQHNADLLINRSKSYQIGNDSITVTGLDDFIEGNANFKQAIQDVGYEKHHFVLIHSPLHQERLLEQLREINAARPESERLNISYAVAGHNHGGQITLLGWAPYLPQKSGDYVNGWYNDERPYLYVSKGFGTSTIPFRFGARSEITLFRYFL